METSDTLGVPLGNPKSRRPRLAALASTFVLLLATDCAQPVLRRDWSGYDGPGAEAFHRESLPPPTVADPLEPLNRSAWALNHALIVAVAEPLGAFYRLIVPRFARDRIRDFAANLVYPRNLVTNLLQAEWSAARDETTRFAINSTVGIGGLWDPATRWFEIEAAPDDFGQVFSRWGWHPSTFVVLPIFGPSTVRDGVGLIPDAALDPATYFFPAGPALTFNELVESIPGYRHFTASSADAYDDARLLWSLAREARIDPPRVGGPGDDTGAVQSLEAAFLAPRDPDFADCLGTGQVTIPTTGRTLPYSYRLQAGRAPIVFLVPGLGTHRQANASLALAEMVWARGFSVAIVSNALSFEFVLRGSSVPVPGHAPVDAHDVHVALDAVDRDLDERHPGRTGARVYLGYSLGAFHGFYIAAEESDPEQALVRFDRYLLLDPPVDLLYAMQRVDGFFEVPLALPAPQREAEVRRILLKAVKVATEAQDSPTRNDAYSRLDPTNLAGGTLTPALELPFSNEEAKFLIGLAFRRSLQALLYTGQGRDDMGVLLTERRPLRRQPVYEEIGDYSFEMYFYAFVFPYYRERLRTVSSAEQMIALNELESISGPLRGNPKLRVFANRNDFLTRDAEIEWLMDLVGPERVRFFPTGGHLGNLHRPEVQAEVMSTLTDLAPDA
jgi:ABC-type transporter lipoprotein component MlaA